MLYPCTHGTELSGIEARHLQAHHFFVPMIDILSVCPAISSGGCSDCNRMRNFGLFAAPAEVYREVGSLRSPVSSLHLLPPVECALATFQEEGWCQGYMGAF